MSAAGPSAVLSDQASVLYDAPVLAHVVRSGLVESVHCGAVALTAADGTPTRQIGAASAAVFPRSANKPLQGVAMLRAGLDLDGALLALVCASHSGEPFHLDGVRRILSQAGLGEADLQNTPDLPYDEQERTAWTIARRAPRCVAQNCSGKHAGMLAACVAAGWDTAGYLDPSHPLQRLTRSTLGELAGEPVTAVGIDGCGAPVMSLSLVGLARAFGRLASAPARSPEGRVAVAIRGHPQWLGGTRRDVTALIRGVPGLVAKDGAEGVYAAGLADGRGVALKIADGGQRARPVVMAAVLRSMGVRSPALDDLAYAPVLGHGEPVGAVVAVGC